jgi:hypothetical protein
MRPACAALLLLSACARDLVTRYPGRADLVSDTATLEIRFTRPVKNLHASVNGVPLAAGTNARKLLVAGIPPGPTTVMLAADGLEGERVFTLDLAAGKRMVVPLSVPGESFSRTLVQAAMVAVVYVGYLALRGAL